MISPYSVLLIERQSLFLPYLKQLLARDGARVVSSGPLPNARRLLQLRPDVVCVDVDHLKQSAFSGLRTLRRALPHARIVAYTQQSDPAWTALAKSVGADIVLGPDADANDVISATRVNRRAALRQVTGTHGA
jgi:DNA-binding NarL/FixJ family response regulator